MIFLPHYMWAEIINSIAGVWDAGHDGRVCVRQHPGGGGGGTGVGAVAARGRGLRGQCLRLPRAQTFLGRGRPRPLVRLQPQQVAHGTLRLHRFLVRPQPLLLLFLLFISFFLFFLFLFLFFFFCYPL